MNRTRKLILLLGVLAVAGSATAIALGVRQYQEQVQAVADVVLEVQPDAVTGLEISTDEGDLAFERGDQWTYTGDETFPVDQDALTERLTTFSSFAVSFVITDVQDLSQYGLSDPTATIRLTAADTEYEVLVGDVSQMDELRYVSIGDGKVYLASTDPMSVFDVTLLDLIDNDEVPTFDAVSEVSISGDVSTTIQNDPDNTLSFSEDDPYVAGDVALDATSVDAYLDTISGLDLTDYVVYQATEDDVSAYGFDEPDLTVEVTYQQEDAAESEAFTLHIARDPEEAAAAEETDADDTETITAYARVGDSPIIYRLNADSYTALMDADTDAFRHSAVLPVSFTEVQSLDVTLEGEEYAFAVSGDEDQTATYGDQDVDIAPVQSALEALTASEFTTEQPEEQQEIALTVGLDNANHPEVDIEIYRHDGTNCLVVVDGEPTALVDRAAVVDLVEAVNGIVLGG